MSLRSKLLSLLISTAMLVAEGSVSTSQTPPPLTIFLERSNIVGIGNKLYVLRLPTLNAGGAITYFDVEINLAFDPNGNIANQAVVITKVAPAFLTKEFIPGTYDDANGGQCLLGTSAADGGRTTGSLVCQKSGDNDTYPFSANWITGPIAGHPYETSLTVAGINHNTGAANVAWGEATGRVAGSRLSYNCFGSEHNNISVQQSGPVLAINNFRGDNVVNCTHSFHLIQP
jgi:hypothetical protein